MKNWLDFTPILLAHAEGPGSPCGLLGAYWKEIKGKKLNIFVLIFLTMFYCWHFYFWKYFYLIVCILFWKKKKIFLSYQAGQYGRLDTLNSRILPLFQILDTEPGWCNISGGAGGGGGGGLVGWDISDATCQVYCSFCFSCSGIFAPSWICV